MYADSGTGVGVDTRESTRLETEIPTEMYTFLLSRPNALFPNPHIPLADGWEHVPLCCTYVHQNSASVRPSRQITLDAHTRVLSIPLREGGSAHTCRRSYMYTYANRAVHWKGHTNGGMPSADTDGPCVWSASATTYSTYNGKRPGGGKEKKGRDDSFGLAIRQVAYLSSYVHTHIHTYPSSEGARWEQPVAATIFSRLHEIPAAHWRGTRPTSCVAARVRSAGLGGRRWYICMYHWKECTNRCCRFTLWFISLIARDLSRS